MALVSSLSPCIFSGILPPRCQRSWISEVHTALHGPWETELRLLKFAWQALNPLIIFAFPLSLLRAFMFVSRKAGRQAGSSSPPWVPSAKRKKACQLNLKGGSESASLPWCHALSLAAGDRPAEWSTGRGLGHSRCSQQTVKLASHQVGQLGVPRVQCLTLCFY